VELADARGQLGRAADEALKAWADDSALSSRFTMPWGEEYTGATLVDMYLAELATHVWDLAQATGQLDKLDRALALPALDGARVMIKPQYRDMVEPGAPFGAEVTPPPGADDWERLDQSDWSSSSYLRLDQVPGSRDNPSEEERNHGWTWPSRHTFQIGRRASE
jgi:uncharacterized protein (TIGR03086 family)